MSQSNAFTPLEVVYEATAPFPALRAWLDAASEAEPENPNAAQLATVDAAGMPNIRTVLVKMTGEEGLVFFTNLNSPKSRELGHTPKAALLLYWRGNPARQIRIRGTVTQVPDEQADRYFGTRPRESRLGAHASRQSETLSDRATLEAALDRYRIRFATEEVPRPPLWSGFRLMPTVVEFWQEGAFRLHHRLVFEKIAGAWSRRLLYP